MNYNIHHMHYNEQLAYAMTGMIAHYSQSANRPSANTSRSAFAANPYLPSQLQGQTEWHAYTTPASLRVGACTGAKQISQVRGDIGIGKHSRQKEGAPVADFPVNSRSSKEETRYSHCDNEESIGEREN